MCYWISWLKNGDFHNYILLNLLLFFQKLGVSIIQAVWNFIIYGILLAIVLIFVANTNVVIDTEEVKRRFKERIMKIRNKSENWFIFFYLNIIILGD